MCSSDLIRSLDNDERFDREKKDDGTIWYRKRTPEQIEALNEQEAG